MMGSSIRADLRCSSLALITHASSWPAGICLSSSFSHGVYTYYIRRPLMANGRHLHRPDREKDLDRC